VAEDGDSVPRSREAAGEEGAAHLADEARHAIQDSASPEGIVTILFTDIVDSTRLRQRLGDDASQERFRQHNQVVRAQIEKHGGFEVKTQGDGFMIAFSDVTAALGCAVEIQRAIADDNLQHPTEKIEVRIGLNCGQAIKEEEDFFGGAVIVAARLGALAKGGQILVSEAVRVLAGLPQGIGYVRHGRRRLKGLAGSYDVWSVPWREGEARGFAKLWANPLFRVTAPVMLVALIGGGVVGGLALGRGGGAGEPSLPAPEIQKIAIHFDVEGSAQIQSGDCLSEDLVLKATGEGTVTGGISGHITITADTIFYAIDGYADEPCHTGFLTSPVTMTDANGNTLLGTIEGPVSLTHFLEQEDEGGGSLTLVVTITGGTGIYEGAIGTGTCTSVFGGRFNPDGSSSARLVGDCSLEFATGEAPVAAPEPLIVQLAASPLEVLVSGGSFDSQNTVSLAVLYGNTREEVQTGLSLRLPVPEGAEILASALGEAQTTSAGERIWSLPDLPPGELQRFEFAVQFLAAETSAIPLMVEVVGEGFEAPVPSDSVIIEVVQ